MNDTVKNIIWWAGVLLLQCVFIFFTKFTLFYTPYIYLLLLFRIQPHLSRISLLFIAFALGFLVDSLTNSWGVHIFSATFIAFILPYFTGIFSPNTVDDDVKFSLAAIGYFRFSIILFIIYFIYHILIHLLWNFTLLHIGHQLLKGTIATVIATGITLLIYRIFSKKPDNENG